MADLDDYHRNVKAITSLGWNYLNMDDLQRLMFISLETAREFADSLTIALNLYPQDKFLKSMAQGELSTNNLTFNNWHTTGDHWEFLAHFLSGVNEPPEVIGASRTYLSTITSLSPAVRAMSIFSREAELPGIFSKILTAPIWKRGLPEHLLAFKYYLEKHIELDSKDGGHKDLVGHLRITNEIQPFYSARLKLYTQSIPNLLKN